MSCLCPSQVVLRQHAAEEAKLSYTGEPIVKWPKRVSSSEVTLGVKRPAMRVGPETEA